MASREGATALGRSEKYPGPDGSLCRAPKFVVPCLGILATFAPVFVQWYRAASQATQSTLQIYRLSRLSNGLILRTLEALPLPRAASTLLGFCSTIDALKGIRGRAQ